MTADSEALRGLFLRNFTLNIILTGLANLLSQRRAGGQYASCPSPDSNDMNFSIITPSFRGSAWLKLCIASVADQSSVTLEHIVQDSCSDDDTKNWLPNDRRVKAFIEKDSGMYDAVNRGFKRAQGDILAYLNCDEQ